MSMFDLDPIEPTVDDVVDDIVARRQAADRERNARRRGTRTSHDCPICGRRTFRRIRRYPTAGTVDARCQPCTNEARTAVQPADVDPTVARQWGRA